MNIIEFLNHDPSKVYIVVSDGKEQTRIGENQHEKFRQEVENFIDQRYGDIVAIEGLVVMTLEFYGSIFAELNVKPGASTEKIYQDFILSHSMPN